MNQSNLSELSRLSKLIDLIYQGATDLEAWRNVPSAIGEWMDAYSCLIFTPLHTPEHGGFSVTHNLSAQVMELWATKYYQHDIWALRAMEKKLVVTGNVLRDQDLVAEEEFLASTMWLEFLAPVGIGRLITGIVFSGEEHDDIPVICTCHRPFSTPFATQDADKLQLILPHISRALGVMFRLRDAEFKVATSLAALDRIPSGVLLFNSDGAVAFANGAAHRVLDQKDGLRLCARPGDREADLLAGGSHVQDLLDEAVREAIAPDIRSPRHFSRALTIPRLSGKTAYVLHFSSLPSRNEFGVGADAPRAIAFLNDGAAPIRLDGGLLKSTYGLTVAEIRTAELMADGCSLEEAATQLDVSVNTVKTQLKQIYDKTNTNNRAKLVRLLMALTA